ncbi:50S ribosomal protein L23 [bacterium]|uniref:50S ribosomal protein L23 n=2 Tax=Katanobacteria TaxID=422282 RepID=A0A2M7X2Z1_UNCKA|nr:50S ribosomal protein L23 [bacterium]PIP56918.1 MAG: 50S ribosomal protein L23 [candidate division WWE3 bacterium CG22_combo_CG10-13_8_21_14_all_39_12]PJA40552.1 MAG: 50S ribosomal protein L23 [candidate division WWE3 bacterium CG_4_9_14_3_um_filter_39_7]
MIVKPIVSEKSMRLVSQNIYMFVVETVANKKSIAGAINELYEVEPTNVRVYVRPGKEKRIARSRKTTRTASRKIAYVTLPEGKTIPGFDKVLEVENENEES